MKISKKKLHDLQEAKVKDASFNVLQHIKEAYPKLLLRNSRIDYTSLNALLQNNLITKTELYGLLDVFTNLFEENVNSYANLINSDFFAKNLQNRVFSQKQLRKFFESFSDFNRKRTDYEGLQEFSNTSILKCFIGQKVVSFSEILNLFHNTSTLYKLLSNTEFFEFLNSQNLLDDSALQDILKKSSSSFSDFRSLHNNTALSHALKNSQLYNFDTLLDVLLLNDKHQCNLNALTQSKFLAELFEDSSSPLQINISNLKHFYDFLKTSPLLAKLADNIKLFRCLLVNNILTFDDHLTSLRSFENGVEQFIFRCNTLIPSLHDLPSAYFDKTKFYQKLLPLERLHIASNKNLLVFLLENKCTTFQQFIQDIHTTIQTHHSKKYPCFRNLLNNMSFFKYALPRKLVSNDDLKILRDIFNFENRLDLYALLNNSLVIKRMIQKKLLHFDDLSSIKPGTSDFDLLLARTDLFQYLFKYKQISTNSLTTLYNSISNVQELKNLIRNPVLISELISKNITTLQEFFQRFNDSSELISLLNAENVFETLIKNSLLDKNSVHQLIKHLKTRFDIAHFFQNKHLFHYSIDNVILYYDIDHLTDVAHCKNAQSLFRFLKDLNARKPEYVSKLDHCEKTYMLRTFNLDESQLSAFQPILQNNEFAQNRLRQIIDNNLESAFNFETLKQHLSKTEKKQLLNI